MRKLFDTLDKVRRLLSDPEISSIRLVVNPEKMVIKETQRTYTYLNLYGYATDAIICNRIIPDEVTDPVFRAGERQAAREHRLHRRSLRRTADADARRCSGRKSAGWKRCASSATLLYGDTNPVEKLFAGKTAPDHRAGRRLHAVSVPLPFADKKDLDIYRSRDELTLRVGPYRRNIVLPYTLMGFGNRGCKIRTINPQHPVRQRQVTPIVVGRQRQTADGEPPVGFARRARPRSASRSAR